MIKVNLLRNMGLAKGGMADAADAIGPEAVRMGVAKLIAILVFPLLLYVYERVTLNDAEVALHTVEQKVQAIKNERAKFGDAGPKIEMYNKEKARVDKELEVVRTIARNRLREVKALDAIQTIMPGKTWAKKISIDGSVVRLEGYTSSNDGVSDLMRALDNNPFFSKIEPKYTAQEVLANGTSVKKFELEFRIGKSE